jgi:hypothetical protein
MIAASVFATLRPRKAVRCDAASFSLFTIRSLNVVVRPLSKTHPPPCSRARLRAAQPTPPRLRVFPFSLSLSILPSRHFKPRGAALTVALVVGSAACLAAPIHAQCSPSCLNGGTCVNSSCVCAQYWTGPQCNLTCPGWNDKWQLPCNGFGSCDLVNASRPCTCEAGYGPSTTGTDCSENIYPSNVNVGGQAFPL